MGKLAKALTASAGNAGGSKLYVEDVFSTYLYDGNSSNRNIVNDVDLGGEGGLVWIKARSNAKDNELFDTERGIDKRLITNNTSAEYYEANSFSGFNSNGFSLSTAGNTNGSAVTYASWSFRKAEKFFDVVTYTGNSTVGRTVAHNLGVAPAWMVIKCTNAARNWCTYHVSLGNGYQIILNNNAAKESTALWNSTTPTATEFTLGNDADVNGTGNTYVAYLFASDAGGYGDDGSENIIKCASYTGNGVEPAGPIINLGFEPQWILIKDADTGTNWTLFDNMRGMPVGGADARLFPNLSNAEADFQVLDILPTGFQLRTSAGGFNENNKTYIYIAIRRPMKTPEAGTEVYKPDTYSGNGSTTATLGSGIVCAGNVLTMIKAVNNSTQHVWVDTLRGGGRYLQPNGTDAEIDNSAYWTYDFKMDGWTINASGSEVNSGSWNYVAHTFKRAAGFMDAVAYTGNGSYGTIAHNLTVSPELVFYKGRNEVSNWTVIYSTSAQGATSRYLSLNNTDTSGNWGNAQFTATAFGKAADTNTKTYIAYLFATLAGISKVGTYTGTAGNLNVDCGFSAGARFILIKRTDSTGDWYVWDSARGISASGTNDPYLFLNSTAAEVTNTDYIALLSSGFTVTSSAPAALNASGGSYLFLAIA